MELLIAAVVGGLFLALLVMVVLWRTISAAVDNFLRWLNYNFGNDRSDRPSVEEKKHQRGPPEVRE